MIGNQTKFLPTKQIRTNAGLVTLQPYSSPQTGSDYVHGYVGVCIPSDTPVPSAAEAQFAKQFADDIRGQMAQKGYELGETASKPYPMDEEMPNFEFGIRKQPEGANLEADFRDAVKAARERHTPPIADLSPPQREGGMGVA